LLESSVHKTKLLCELDGTLVNDLLDGQGWKEHIGDLLLWSCLQVVVLLVFLCLLFTDLRVVLELVSGLLICLLDVLLVLLGVITLATRQSRGWDGWWDVRVHLHISTCLRWPIHRIDFFAGHRVHNLPLRGSSSLIISDTIGSGVLLSQVSW